MTLGLVTSALKVFWLILNLHLFGLWLSKTSFTFFERVVVIIIWFIYLWLGCVFTVTQAFLYLWWAEATLRLWDFSLQGLLLLGSTGSWGDGFSGAQASRCGGFPCWGARVPECGDWVAAVCRLSCSAACGILVPWPGIKSASPCIERQILKPWITREPAPPRFPILNVVLFSGALELNKCWDFLLML